METKQIQIYEFKELSEDAKEKVLERERNRRQEYNYDSLEFIEEDLIYQAEELFKEAGITWDRIEKELAVPFEIYPLNCFATGNFIYENESFNIEATELIKKRRVEKMLLKDNDEVEEDGEDDIEQYLNDCGYIEIRVITNNRGNKEITFFDSSSRNFINEEYIPEPLIKISEKVISLYDEVCNKLAKSAEEQYEYIYSDEYIIGELEVNDRRYLTDGKEVDF